MPSKINKSITLILFLFFTSQLMAAPSEHFVTTWETTVGDTVITIPTFPGETYNYAVDWDNNLTPDATGITGDAMHDFGSAGVHTIRIVGTFPRFFLDSGTEKDKILSIEQWGTQAWTSMNRAFSGATNLVNNATDTPNLSGVTSLFKMFDAATNIGTGTGVWTWDTANINGMAQMFKDAASFDKDISSWNVANVTNFTGMFSGATLSTANYDALLISWDGQVLSPNEPFNAGNSRYCSLAAQTARANIIANDGWSITDGGSCEQDYFISTWKTDNPGTSNDTSITLSFSSSSGTLPLYDVDWEGDGIFDDSNLTGGSITHNYGTAGTYTVKIRGVLPKFEANHDGDEEKIISIDQWGTNSWKSMELMFYNSIYVVNNAPDVPDLSAVNNLIRTFEKAESIGFGSANWNWNTSTITTLQSTFKGATSFDADIGSWDVENVTDFFTMFSDVTMPDSTYDAILVGWGAQNLAMSQSVFFGNAMYCSQAAHDARNIMIQTYDWNVIDNGHNHACTIANEAPIITTANSYSVQENITNLFNVQATDHETDVVSYSVSGGADGALFSINPSSGLLKFINPPDFESPNSSLATNIYLLEVSATDNGSPILSSSQIITVTVTDVSDVNNPPVITSASSANIVENTSAVLTATATDADLDTITFSLAGVDAALFSINQNSGMLVFNNAPDFEAPLSNANTNTYIIDIIATDDGSPNETDTQTLTVNVTDVFDPLPSHYFITTWKTDNPGSSNPTSITIPVEASTVGQFYHVDWDNDGTIDEFNINGAVTHDFLVAGTYTIRMVGIIHTIKFNDTGDKEKLLSIDQWGINTWGSLAYAFKGASNLVNNAQDAPDLSAVDTLLHSFYGTTSIGLGSANWNWDTSTITSMNATFSGATSFDADIGSWNVENVAGFFQTFNGVTFSDANYDALLINWNLQNLIAGAGLSVGDSKYCSQAAHDARKNINNFHGWFMSDGGHNHSCTLINEPPVFHPTTNISIDENQTFVFTITTTDHPTDTSSYAINGGADSILFSVGATSGALSFNAAPDFETPASSLGTNTYVVEVIATDDGIPMESSTQIYTINVTDVLENTAPIFTSSSNVNVAENQTQVITVSTTDNEGDGIIYSISGGADQLLFTIDSNTGALTFNTAPDFETPNSSLSTNIYKVNVTATDDGLPTPENSSQSLTITVVDVAENTAPSITSATAVNVEENQTSVITITATDPEFDTISFSISGGIDASKFTIISTSGAIIFNTSPDFEMPNSAASSNTYLLEITATDNGTPVQSVSQNISIIVTDIPDFTANEVFVTTWKTDNPGTSNSTSITIPTNSFSLYAYSVDWNGDGDFDDSDENIIYTDDATHDYGVSGIYTVKIGGLFPAIQFNNEGDKDKILSIEQWGTNSWESFSSAFKGTSNVINNATDTPNLSQCNEFTGAFSGASSIGAVSETGNWNWDTSNIVSMINTFRNASSFDQDLGVWNVANVNNFSFMFDNVTLSYENYDSLLISWNTQTLATNQSFFVGNSKYCSLTAQAAHDNLINNFGWTISDGGLDASLCANQLIEITSLPFAGVLENQTSVLTLMVANPNSATLSFSISGGNDMNLFSISSTGVITFNNSPDFENPISFSGTNDYFVEVTVSDDSQPIQSYTQLIKVSVLDQVEFNSSDLFVTTWKTDNPGLTGDTSVLISVRGGQTYNYRVDWNGDDDFDDFEEDIFYTGSAIHDYGVAGTYTIKIFGEFPSFYLANNEDKEKLISIDQWGINKWTTFEHAFNGGINAVMNATDTPDLSNTTNTSHMFINAQSIAQGNGNWNWDTATITDMFGMFSGASSFDQDISTWDIENVTDMSSMFNDVSLSTINYEALLIGWSLQNLNSSAIFSAGNSSYCSQIAQDAHDLLTIDNDWTINDLGRENTCANDVRLSLQISSQTTEVSIGDLVEYTIEVNNSGIADALNATVFDVLPLEISSTTWVCSATGTASCSPSGAGEINDVVNLPTGDGSIVYTVSATVTTTSFTEIYYQAQVDAALPQVDSFLSNNSDDYLINNNDIVFSNSFETTIISNDAIFSNSFEAPIVMVKTSKGHAMLNLSNYKKLSITPLAILKGLSRYDETTLWAHIRMVDNHTQIRLSNKIQDVWQVGQWQDSTYKNSTTLYW